MNKQTEERIQLIHEIIRSIPYGRVATYGQIAKIAGMPKGSRYVAFALRHTSRRAPVPWHRVINSQGRSSIAGSWGKKQLALLKKERVENKNGKIDLIKYQWEY